MSVARSRKTVIVGGYFCRWGRMAVRRSPWQVVAGISILPQLSVVAGKTSKIKIKVANQVVRVPMIVLRIPSSSHGVVVAIQIDAAGSSVVVTLCVACVDRFGSRFNHLQSRGASHLDDMFPFLSEIKENLLLAGLASCCFRPG